MLSNKCEVKLTDISVTPIVLNESRMPAPILQQIDLHINRGEWITLIGRNGSGKSTLAKVIAGTRVDGLTGKTERHPSSAGRTVPIVMQQPEAAMVGATPWEDVVLMLEQNEAEPGDIVGLAEQALARVGMGGRMHQPVGTLSGGQKQLVAIAGCLAVYAPLLILDEAASMLDPDASIYVQEQARALNRAGTTVVWITQGLDEIRTGDRIVAMEGGRIAFDGSAAEWYERPNGLDGGSFCERLGFEAPYSVQVAWEMERLGVSLTPFPITPAELAKAVSAYGL